MLDTCRNHPFVTLTVMVFGAAAALITFFHELTGEHFLPFLDRHGWGLDMPFWYYSLLVVLGVAILVLQGSVIKAFCQFRRWEKVRWLEALLEADDQNMEQRIRLEPLSTAAKLHPALSPYVHISMYFLNISVHSLTLEEQIKGRFTFDDHSLDDARILWRKDQTKRGEIKHGERYYVVLEQPLSHPVVDRIQQTGVATLGGKSVEVCFTYRDTAGNLHPRYVKVETWIPLKE